MESTIRARGFRGWWNTREDLALSNKDVSYCGFPSILIVRHLRKK